MLNRYIVISLLVCISTTFLFSCKEKGEVVVESSYNPELIPTVKTHNDTMYISDSGRVRYKVIAKTMLLFDKASDPYTLFPDKAYMEQYDTLMNIITTLHADSVWNYSKKKLWKLKGNVNIVNVEGKSFDSEELFWDELKDKVYSNTYVVINEPNNITMRAYAFESTLDMIEYTYWRATDVDIYVKEEVENVASENESLSEK